MMDGNYKLDHIKDGFTQFAAVNVDYNNDTLDDKRTFHEMGIIACSVWTYLTRD